MTISYGLMAVIPAIFILFYLQVHFIYRLEDNTLQLENQVISQEVKAVEGYLTQVQNIADGIANSQNIHRLLISNSTQLKNLWEFEPYKDPIHTEIANILEKYEDEIIKGIRIYCDPDVPLLSDPHYYNTGIFESTDKIRTSLWYGMEGSRDMTSWTVSPFFLNSWEEENLGFIAYMKKILYYVGGKEKTAYVAVYFNRTYLDDVIGDYGNYPHSAIYLIDDKDGIVSMNGKDEFLSYILSYSDIDSLMPEEGKFSLLKYGKMQLWSVFYEIDQTNWRLVFSVSRDSMIREARTEGNKFIGIYIGMSVFLCFLMLMLSGSITKRVSLLKDKMNTVKKMPPALLEEDIGKDEIGELAQSYNYMAGQIEVLMNEKLEIADEKKRMEINLLRAQINPHFLYNTLDMIAWLALKGKTEEVTDSIQTLSRFYRLSLNHGEAVTVLEKEVELAEQYLKLQSKRVGCEITFLADVPDELLELKIPQFLLQPLIENSLKHGILEKENPEGVITLVGWKEKEWISLVLSDDGVGMEQEKADQLMEKIRLGVLSEKEGHIGLQNVYRRLLLYYGETGFTMTFESMPGQGLTIGLNIQEEAEKEE